MVSLAYGSHMGAYLWTPYSTGYPAGCQRSAWQGDTEMVRNVQGLLVAPAELSNLQGERQARGLPWVTLRPQSENLDQASPLGFERLGFINWNFRVWLLKCLFFSLILPLLVTSNHVHWSSSDRLSHLWRWRWWCTVQNSWLTARLVTAGCQTYIQSLKRETRCFRGLPSLMNW